MNGIKGKLWIKLTAICVAMLSAAIMAISSVAVAIMLENDVFFKENSLELEIVLVDDCSTDKSKLIAIELQNKIDNLHSFNRIDTIIKGNSTLDTAKKVIEIPAVSIVSVPKLKPIPVNYNWSIGY